MRNFDTLRDADRVTSAFRDALEKQERFADQVSQHVGQLEALLGGVEYPGLHLLSLLTPLCGEIDAHDSSWAPESIFIAGTGPWNERDLKHFFENRGFDITDDFEVAGAIVLGSSNVDKDLLKKFAEFSRQSDLSSVYSQEIFVIGLIQDVDPFELLDQEQINDIADLHNPIQHLLQLGVTWPNSSAWVQDEDNEDDGDRGDSGGEVSDEDKDEVEGKESDSIPSFDLSPQLEAVIGPGPLNRTEVVAKLWSYIKSHGLQDLSNRRFINCDHRLTGLFGKQQVSMFEIPGLIARHIK